MQVDLHHPALAAVRRASDQARDAQRAYRQAMIEARRQGQTFHAISVAGRCSEKTVIKIAGPGQPAD
jgi:hypothetical protein